MGHKKEGPTNEGRACVRFPATQVPNTKNGSKSQGNNGARVDLAELFEHPRVVIERANNRIFVIVKNRPWGMLNVDRECLSDVGAERYAERLRERLRAEEKREEVRRAKIREAKHRERQARLESRNG